MSRGAFCVGLLAFTLLPIWSSGLRDRMSLLEFIVGHTIFSVHETLYVPEEYWTREVSHV